MIWNTCLVLSVVAMVLCLLLPFLQNKFHFLKEEQKNLWIFCFFAGTSIAGIFLFFPAYMVLFTGDQFQVLQSLLLSLHNTIRLFIVDGEFTFLRDYLVNLSKPLYNAYTVWGILIFVAAPVLTFSFVLSFFRNVAEMWRYRMGYCQDAYVFSELNVRSLALATDLKKKDKKCVIVFTDFFEINEEASYEMANAAQQLGAICVKKDISTIDFSFHSKKKELNYLVMGVDDAENIEQALALIAKNKRKENTSLYLCSSSVESKLLFSAVENTGMKIRRIDEVCSLVYRTLYDEGHQIFENAVQQPDGTKNISAVIVGMGAHGTEMLKALSWIGQMDGYTIQINAVDRSPLAKDKFTALCPELMSDALNHQMIEGEAAYDIDIHAGVDATTAAFSKLMLEMPQPSYVLVCLGDDNLNLQVAIQLRMLFLQKGYHPIIQAIVYNSKKKEMLGESKNFSGQSFDIAFLGDVKSSFSEKVILGFDAEKDAFARHKKYCSTPQDEESFWKYEYNYKSSMASAIHTKLKRSCGMKGIEKPVSDRTPEETRDLRVLEHKRWNAYMRSEGFCYAPVRNNLAKLHHCLVPFDELSLAEQEKDEV